MNNKYQKTQQKITKNTRRVKLTVFNESYSFFFLLLFYVILNSCIKNGISIYLTKRLKRTKHRRKIETPKRSKQQTNNNWIYNISSADLFGSVSTFLNMSKRSFGRSYDDNAIWHAYILVSTHRIGRDIKSNLPYVCTPWTYSQRLATMWRVRLAFRLRKTLLELSR